VAAHRASVLATTTGVKSCRGCGVVFPLGEFPPDKKSPHLGAARCWDCTRERRRAYYRNDPETAKALVKRRADSMRDQLRQYSREWYEANRERAIRDQYVHKARRRARQANAECGCVTEPALRLMAEMLGSKCVYCGDPFEHWDHAVPLSRGGLHCLDNLVPACAPCNLRKRTQTQEEFMAQAGLIS
jgi:5-methylcytosine-specific restriction endonuclease McrA